MTPTEVFSGQKASVCADETEPRRLWVVFGKAGPQMILSFYKVNKGALSKWQMRWKIWSEHTFILSAIKNPPLMLFLGCMCHFVHVRRLSLSNTQSGEIKSAFTPEALDMCGHKGRTRMRNKTSELDSVRKPRSNSFAATTQLTQQPETKWHVLPGNRIV